VSIKCNWAHFVNNNIIISNSRMAGIMKSIIKLTETGKYLDPEYCHVLKAK